jgi:hypothetical protein
MVMDDQTVLQRFIEHRPLAVMTRLIVNEVLDDDLDAVFAQYRDRNYTREMLFSNLCVSIADGPTFCWLWNHSLYNKRGDEKCEQSTWARKASNTTLSMNRQRSVLAK